CSGYTKGDGFWKVRIDKFDGFLSLGLVASDDPDMRFTFGGWPDTYASCWINGQEHKSMLPQFRVGDQVCFLLDAAARTLSVFLPLRPLGVLFYDLPRVSLSPHA